MPGDQTIPRPFLKWAGGKSQLLDELLARVPETYQPYREPFVGAGALFWALRPPVAHLSDVNEELITTYVAVRDQIETVICYIQGHRARHSEAYYYQVRGKGHDLSWLKPAAQAARMIYLNKSGYGGLYRVSANGFNVPWGNFASPHIDDANLRACSTALNRNQVKLSVMDFEAAMDAAAPGDFVYADPPYFAVSQTANFTAYTTDGFSYDDQRRLASMYRELDRRGVMVMLSNSDSPFAHRLYVGYRIERVQARRAINSDTSKRGQQVGEVIVTNYDYPDAPPAESQIMIINTHDLDLHTPVGVEVCVERMMAAPMDKPILLEFLIGRQRGEPHASEEHAELHRLQSLLNSCYRGRRFNFLGDNMAARLFRQGVREMPNFLADIRQRAEWLLD